MHTALTIAGSDSGAGAGIQADLKTFAAHGVYGTSAITAVTAQNTVGVSHVVALDPAMVAAQIDMVASDIRLDAVKLGMLANARIVEAVAAALERWHPAHVVLDPVMVAKSGDPLLEPDAVAAVRDVLLPRATVVTPNRPEAEAIAGMAVRTLQDARAAARRIRGGTGAAVVIKGGHFDGPRLVNLLFDGTSFLEFEVDRVETRHTHGTGCTFASAVAACLALGLPLGEAVDRATRYVAGAVAHGLPIGRGHGPVDHFWAMRPGGPAA